MQTEQPIVLSVRPMTPGDIDAVADWFESLDDVSLFDRAAVVPATPDTVRARLKGDFDPGVMPPKALWYVAEDERGRPAAMGALRAINYINGDAVLPAFVGRHMRGRGVAIRLVAMLLDTAFTRLRLVRVTTCYRDDNLISARLTRRAGFSEEGRLRRALLSNGSHLDMVVMGMLREEWSARREALNAELDSRLVLRFSGSGNEQYNWPRRGKADILVRDLAARRDNLEVAGRNLSELLSDPMPMAGGLLNRVRSPCEKCAVSDDRRRSG